ncbi:MAG TPA: hypothetical protein VJQ54_11625 [Candidatus Sulfotelmatobacter sp.]|nr:hypothetical protein [Candidatus Sulfotelmatobacter sp.]
MTSAAQKKAIQNHRKRLRGRGLSRFEVQGRTSDKQLLRDIARKLAEDSSEALKVRRALENAVAESDEIKGGIWGALRRSPLVGAGVDFERLRSDPRELDL